MIKYLFGCKIPVYKRSMMTFNRLPQEQWEAFITPLNYEKPKSTRWYFLSECGLYRDYGINASLKCVEQDRQNYALLTHIILKKKILLDKINGT